MIDIIKGFLWKAIFYKILKKLQFIIRMKEFEH